MVKGLMVKSFILSVGMASVMASTASAFSYKMNAMCFLPDAAGASAQKFNPTEKEIREGSNLVKKTPTEVTDEDVRTKFRIASVSKVLTTHWAVAKLGPEYRFKTKLSITPTNPDKTCNVHVSGDMDIFMGKEMLTTVFDQLKPILTKQNCSKITQLSFDEKFIVPFFSPRKLFILQHRDESDFRGSDPNLFYGQKTTLKAFTYFVRNFSKIPVFEIKPALSADFKKYIQEVPVKTYSFKSRPLFMMMREFNAYSSNVPPSVLFERLGGSEAYKNFIQSRLGLDTETVEMYNGSGYPVILDNGDKVYNTVSCAGIVRIIQDLDHMLKAYRGSKNFQMADVMAVGGNGEFYSTFKSLYGSSTFENTLVAKTGSADRSITFAGMLQTTAGPLYFAALTEPDSYLPDQLNKPRTYIRDLVSILAERHTLKKFNYTQVGLMIPTDSESKLVEENESISTHLH